MMFADRTGPLGLVMRNPQAKRRWALWLSLGVTGYIALADWALQPLHTAGYWQGVVGYLDGLSAMLQAPGFAVVLFAGLRHGHHTPPGVWFPLVIVNFVIWVV